MILRRALKGARHAEPGFFATSRRVPISQLAGKAPRRSVHVRYAGAHHLLQSPCGPTLGPCAEAERPRGSLLRLVQALFRGWGGDPTCPVLDGSGPGNG